VEVLEEIKKHILCSFSGNHTCYEIILKYGRDRQAIEDNICCACWVTKATDTHSEYVIVTAFP
jgi:hypothetical protein